MSGTIAQPAQAGHAQLPSRLLVSTPRHDPEGFTTLRGSKVFAIMQGDARSRHGVSTEPQPEHLAKVTGGGASMRPGGQVKRSSRDGVAASATTAAVQADIVGATRQVPASLLQVGRPLALIALFILPAALAVQILARRQFRRLAESV